MCNYMCMYLPTYGYIEFDTYKYLQTFARLHTPMYIWIDRYTDESIFENTCMDIFLGIEHTKPIKGAYVHTQTYLLRSGLMRPPTQYIKTYTCTHVRLYKCP